MADSNYTQSNFLGGEWSQFAQGRIDLPAYKTALNVCLNMVPMEEGAATRRSGSRRLGMTAYNASGVLRTFWLPGHLPVICEVTYSIAKQQSFLRFWTQQFVGTESDDLRPLCDAFVQITNISATVPAVVTLASTPPTCMNGDPGWSNTEQVLIYIDPSIPLANGPVYINRQFEILNVGTNQWALYYRDQNTNALIPFDGTQDGAGIQNYGNSFCGHIAQFTAPWASLAEVKSLRLVQTGADISASMQPAYFLSALTPPWALTLVSPAPGPLPNIPWFTFAQASFIDGPYCDPLPGRSQTGNSTGNIWNVGGSPGSTNPVGQVNFYITDGAYAFQPSDVGRAIRIWWQPQLYSASVQILYPTLNQIQANQAGPNVTRVTYNGSYWAANVDPGRVTGVYPPPGGVVAASNQASGQSLDDAWVLLPSQAAFWLYGKIVSISTYSSPNDQVLIQFDVPTGQMLQQIETPSAGWAFSNTNGNQIDTWQLGLFTPPGTGKLAGGYPTTGCYHEGRLILMGAIPDRLDASVPLGLAITPPYGPGPNGFETIQAGTASSLIAVPITPPGSAAPYYIGIYPNSDSYATPCFSPTVLQGGDVLDSNAVSIMVAADAENQILWGKPLHDGIVLGTIGGEFLLLSPGGGITPSNAVIKRTTKFGAKFVEPLNVGHALIFVQALGSRLMEYIVDAFNLNRLTGRHLNEYAKHLTATGIVEIAYQEEKIPIVWCCMGDGSLAGCTYRRMGAAFGDTPPQMMGWHRHTLGNGRLVRSITTGANQNGTLDQLVMLTSDGQDF